MTLSEKMEIAELIRSIVREELHKILVEAEKDTTTTTATGSTENARAYLKKISPQLNGYMSRYTLVDISQEMKSVLTDDEIKYVIIHLDGNDSNSRKNSKELSEILFK